MLFRNFKKGIRGICSLLLTLIIVVCCSLTSMADTTLVDGTVTYSCEGYPAFPTSGIWNKKTYNFTQYCIMQSSGKTYLYAIYNWTDDVKVYYGDGIDSSVGLSSVYYIFDETNFVWKIAMTCSAFMFGGEVLYSSFDIYTDSSCEEIAFPLVAPELSIAKMTAPEMTRLTMREMVGLIPLVVGSMTCLIGLRKGLAALLTRLQKA